MAVPESATGDAMIKHTAGSRTVTALVAAVVLLVGCTAGPGPAEDPEGDVSVSRKIEKTPFLSLVPSPAEVEQRFGPLVTPVGEPVIITEFVVTNDEPAGVSKCRKVLAAAGSLRYEELGIVTFSDKTEPEVGSAFWKVTRYESVEDAAALVDLIGAMIDSCGMESQTDTTLTRVSSFPSSIKGASTVTYGTGPGSDHNVVVRRGKTVLSTASSLSPDRADKLMQLQLDKIDAIE